MHPHQPSRLTATGGKLLTLLVLSLGVLGLLNCKGGEQNHQSTKKATASNCIDSSLIDPSMSCAAVYQPVCGCDGKTYGNECEAKYHHGLTRWTDGPCKGHEGDEGDEGDDAPSEENGGPR